MPRRSLIAITALVGLAALLLPLLRLLAPASDPGPAPNGQQHEYTAGRNGTVLFLTDTANGLANVHIATSFALLEHHPHLDVHYGSFAKLRAEISRVSAAAIRKQPASAPITWHELPDPDYVTALFRQWRDAEGIVGTPGLKGIGKIVKDMELSMAPWEAEEYWLLYSAIATLIDEVDPAVVLVDSLFHPALDACRNLRRAHAVISPNALPDVLAGQQPWGAMFWKYPALGSGYPYPLPFHLIPSNIYLTVRFIYSVLFPPTVPAKRDYLIERGVVNPINFFEVGNGNVPWLMMSIPEASLPLATIPSYVKPCGPMVLDVAPAEVQDAKMAAWLTRAPTILVNLGSVVKYTEARARAMAGALDKVLQRTDAQVLWKFRKLGEYDDAFMEQLKGYIADGRLQIESWLNIDPVSLLQSGHVAVSVHHGGANCYHEAVYAGIPQVILPLWVDLYNFAQTAEYLGIGLWPGKDTAPVWEADALAEGFVQVLGSEAIRDKARALGEVARAYGGRDTAAAEVAKMAVR